MPKDDEPISLHPLKPDEALKAPLQTPPPPKTYGKGKESQNQYGKKRSTRVMMVRGRAPGLHRPS